MKKIIWLGSSRSRIKDFPCQAQDILGHELLKVQYGKMPADWHPLSGVVPGAIEIRVHQPYEHRLIYVSNYPEAIYVLHCFSKKTQRTPQREIEITRVEYAELQRRRQEINQKKSK